jgi:hypothetical protein
MVREAKLLDAVPLIADLDNATDAGGSSQEVAGLEAQIGLWWGALPASTRAPWRCRSGSR